MSLGTVLLIILIIVLIGALPTWPYSGGWGYYPSGGVGLVVVILLILRLAESRTNLTASCRCCARTGGRCAGR